MIPDVKKHKIYYASLWIVIGLGILAFINASYNRTLQGAIVVAMTVFYVSLAIAHHVIHHNGSAKIVVEYLLVGSLVIAVFLFLFQSLL